MHIQSSTLGMWASHQSQSLSIERISERVTPLERSPERDRPMAQSPEAKPAKSPSTYEPECVTHPSDELLQGLEPRLQVLVRIIERITGRPVKLINPEALQSKVAEVGDDALPEPASASNRAAEGPVLVERSGVILRMEDEAVSFRAAGQVRTSDGRTISIDVGFQLQRSFFELTAISEAEVRERLHDPLVISLDGGPASFGSQGFVFDLNGDGQAENLPGLAPGQGFLVHDANRDGQVTARDELFGPRSGDGFAELAGLDQDGNGWIDEGDQDYQRLGLWLDAANGTGGRLVSLAELGIGALSITSVETPFDHKTMDQTLLGRLRQNGVWLGEDGSAGVVQQIDLAV